MLGDINTAIKASPNERIWDLPTLQTIAPELSTQTVWACLQTEASATTWEKSSQLSKIRFNSSGGTERRECSIL
jgi:hypothetical protein